MAKNELMSLEQENSLVEAIKLIISGARQHVATEVNNTHVITCWNIGMSIVEHEQQGSAKAEYGASQMLHLSKRLTKEIGKGFSRSSLFNMRRFYLTYPKIQTLRTRISPSK